MKSGIIIINKEAGYTSFDVVARLRGILGCRKIGHTGTLDPDAVGVLPVCIGKATRVCGLLTDSDKTYEAVLRLGVVSDTQDMTGTILERHEVKPDEETIRQTILSFVGEQEQIPPMYSALKVNGRKLCDLARQGEEVERAPRKITIYGIRIQEIALPVVRMEVRCSKGTYIRTLCHDIGQALGCGGCLQSLQRTRAAGFTLEEARTLDEVEKTVKEGRGEELLLPVDSVFSSYPRAVAAERAEPRLKNGNSIGRDEVVFALSENGKIAGNHADTAEECKNGAKIRIYLRDGRFVGLFELCEGQWRVVRMFLE